MDGLSERRLAENEVIFREANKTLQEFAETIKDDDRKIPFYCECSNMMCRAKIKLQPKAFGDAHKNSQQFILLPGHLNPEIEKVVNEEDGFLVVEKFIKAPPIEEVDA